MIMEAGKFRVLQCGPAAGDPGEPMTQRRPKGSLLENFLSLKTVGPFVLLRPSADWM